MLQKLNIPATIIDQCRKILVSLKQDLLNRAQFSAQAFGSTERSGDEIDQTVAQLEEHSFLVNQERLRGQILEIEYALGRIEQGCYGVCEETGEPIEIDRLLAIPWTRLSIEGAEIRDALKRRFMRI
jgi:DnaK suppressor protein